MAGSTLRVVADISAHGLGHLTQIAPVLQALAARLGRRLSLIVRTGHAPDTVRHVLKLPFRSAPPPPDPGLAMRGPATVDVAASRRLYAALHRDFSGIVEREAKRLKALAPDLLVSDVGYVGLAAAAAAGIPAVALCSLHWGEMVRAYLGHLPAAVAWERDILAAYNSAAAFLLAAPRRSVPGLSNVRCIAPVVRAPGRCRRDLILARAGRMAGRRPVRIGIISFGGIGGALPRVRLSADPSWLWLLPPGLDGDVRMAAHSRRRGGGPAMMSLAAVRDLDFRDLVASADLVVTKTGYGTFMECARHGTPCLFLVRPDWPEAPDLEAWITARGLGRALAPRALFAPGWERRAEGLKRASVSGMTGAREAAGIILRLATGTD